MSHLKPIILFLIFTLFNESYAQNNNIQITAGKPFTTDEREIPIDLISSDSLGTFFLYAKGKYGSSARKIKKFDHQFNPTSETIDLSEDLDKKEYSLGTLKRGNKLFSIIGKTTKEEKKFFAQTIDLSTNAISGREEIASLSVKDKKAKRIFSRFLFGKDKDFGLIYKISDNKALQATYRFSRMDTNLKVVDEYELSLPSDNHSLVKLYWTAKDTFYLVTADKDNVTNPSKTKLANSNFKILLFVRGNLEKEYLVDAEGIYIGNFSLEILDSTLNFRALYATTSRYNLKGSYFKQLDKESGLTLQKKVIPFSQDLIDQHKALKGMGGDLMKILKNKNELPYYVVKQFLSYPNGKTLVLSEQTHSATVQYVTTYYSKNILAVMLDKNGDQLWTRLIKKNNSKTSTPIYSSYLACQRDSGYTLLYTDNTLNLKQNDNKMYRTFDKGNSEVLICTSITEKGEIISSSHQIPELIAYRFRPRLSNGIEKNKILLFSQKPSNVKQQAFFKIEFLK